MSWQDQLNGDSLAWLLEDENPGVRYLALRDLLDTPANDAKLQAARTEAHQNGPIAAVLSAQDPAGYWVKPGPGYNPKYRSSVWAVTLLAQLGASVEEDPRISFACDYMLEHNLTRTGQFTTSGAPSGTVDCLQGNLSWALLEMGCDDSRLVSAFDWMARSVIGEGIAPTEDRAAPVRYYAAKSGPIFECGANYKLPCAWGGAKVMLALAKWPQTHRTPLIERAVQQGIDFLFSVDPADAGYPSGSTGKPSPNWWKFCFPVFYVTDLLQIVEALVGFGYAQDSRLARAIAVIREKQDSQGCWALDYEYTGKTWVDFGPKKKPNKWVTLRALRVLKAVGAG